MDYRPSYHTLVFRDTKPETREHVLPLQPCRDLQVQEPEVQAGGLS